jgi:HB1, ASXL, restriction endonuclease HTH domain
MAIDDDIENATYLWVAETVLLRQKRPLRAGDIVKIGLEDGLFGDKILSKTPQKSMQARLSMDIIKPSNESKFLRTEPGRFFMRSLLPESDVEPSENKKSQISEYVPPRRSPPPTSERVLVVGEKDYKQILDFQGIDFSYQYIISSLLRSSTLKYMPRAQAEIVDGYKQFITYTIIQSGEWVVADALDYIAPNAPYDVVIAYGLAHCLASDKDIMRLISRIRNLTKMLGHNIVCAFNNRSHDLTAHPGFVPTLLSHEQYLSFYCDWEIISSSDETLNEIHPHNAIPHHHSLTRIIARKPYVSIMPAGA